MLRLGNGLRAGFLLLAVAAIVLTGCSADKNADETGTAGQPGPAFGSAAPSFSAELMSGEPVSLQSLKGKPVILAFWATTCAPCKRELPELNKIALEHAADDLVVLAVNTGETPADIRNFFAEIAVDLPVVIDQQGAMISAYEVLALPMTYYIDRDGVLQYRTVGEPRPNQLAHGIEVII